MRRGPSGVTHGGHILSHSAEATHKGSAQHAPQMVLSASTSDLLLSAILTSLEDDKAEDIVQIDLRGKSAMADYMVICSGRSSRQVQSISEKLTEKVKEMFRISARTEGKDSGDWVLIDTGDVIVHVFRPEVREFYALEKMWMPGAGAGETPAS